MSKLLILARDEIVGSFLRLSSIRQAREQHDKGKINVAILRSIEDKAIIELIKIQQEHGLQVVSDGEFLRSWWHMDFFEGLDGVEPAETVQGIQFNEI